MLKYTYENFRKKNEKRGDLESYHRRFVTFLDRFIPSAIIYTINHDGSR